MAFALVGTIGTAIQSASGGALNTLAWGTSETRVAGHLLVCFCTVTSSATLPGTPSGWSIAKQTSGTTSSATVFYKIAAGSDAAPTFSAITGALIAGQLAEFSGNSGFPVDQTGTATSASSPVTATFGGASAATSDLILMAGADDRSNARAPNDTWTSNHATITQAGNNNGVSTRDHYSFGYATSLSSVSGADTAVMTCSITTNITELCVAAATFRVPHQIPNSQSGALSFVGALLIRYPKLCSALLAFGDQLPKISSLKIWLKADALLLNDGDPVGTWYDLSGNAANATASGTARPTFKTNIVNGLPVVRYSGAPQLMNIPLLFHGQPQTIIITVNQTTKSTAHVFDGPVSGDRFTCGLNGLGQVEIYAGSSDLSDTTDHSGNWHVISYIFNGASSAVYVDGTQFLTGNPGTNAGGSMYLGGDGGGATLIGDLAEVTLYNTALSNANRQKVERYMGLKYNVAVPSVTTETFLAKTFIKPLFSGILSFVGFFTSVKQGITQQALNATLSFVGTIPKGISTNLSSALSFVGNLFKSISKLLLNSWLVPNCIDSCITKGLSFASFNNNITQNAQCFTAASGGPLTSAIFWLSKTGSPTGPVTAKLYSLTGIFGTNAIPNTLLATSDSIDASSMSLVGTTYLPVSFNFSTPYTISVGTQYFIAIEWGGYTSGNYISIPQALFADTPDYHPGNHAYYWNPTTTWFADQYDINFGIEVAPSLTKLTKLSKYTGSLSFVGIETAFRFVARTLTSTLSFVGNIPRAIFKIASSALLFIGNLPRLINGLKTATLSFVGTLIRTINKTITATLSFIGAIRGKALKLFTASLSFIGTLLRTIRNQGASVLSFVGNVFKKTITSRTGTLSFVGFESASKFFTRLLTGALSFVGIIKRSTAKLAPGTLSFVGALPRLIKQGCTSALSFAGAIIKQANKRLVSAVLSFVGLLTTVYHQGGQVFQQAINSTLSFVGQINALTKSIRTATLSFSGFFAKQFNKALFAATLSFVGAVLKQTNTLRVGMLNFVGTIKNRINSTQASVLSFIGLLGRRIPQRLAAATLSFATAFTSIKTFFRTLTGTLNFVGAIKRSMAKQVAGTLSWVSTDFEQIRTHLASTLSFVGNTVKLLRRTLTAATLSFVGTFTRARIALRTLTATLNFSGAFKKLTLKQISGVLNFVGTLINAIRTRLASTLSFIGNIFRVLPRILSGTLSFSGALTRAFSRLFEAVLGLAGAMAKTLQTVIMATVAFVGNLAKLPNKALTAVLSFISYLEAVIPVTAIMLFEGTLSFSGKLFTRIGQVLRISLAKTVLLIKTVTTRALLTLRINVSQEEQTFKFKR